MADFQTSTHRARWIFSPGDLREKRHFTNQRAINTLEKYGAMRVEVDVDGSLSYPDPSVGAPENALGRKSLPKPLTVEEEQLMCVFYENKIQEVCGAFRFPHKIQATAIIYFKRFYLQWSIMEHHPKHVMLTCIYASCKIEENHVSAEELGKGIQQDHQVILNNEMIVFQSLGFDLIVYAPYRSIEGFVDDMEAFFLARDGDTPKLKDLCDTAKIVADKIMLTDAPLLYPPGQLALASLRKANLLQTVIDFERYLDDLFLRKHFSHSIADLVKFLDSIDDLVDMLKIPTAKDMRHIDRKLKYCWDPSSQEEGKKREKKSKHRSNKRSLDEMQEIHGATGV